MLRGGLRRGQAEVAAAAGVSTSALGRIERAEGYPTVDTLAAVLAQLGARLAVIWPDGRAVPILIGRGPAGDES